MIAYHPRVRGSFRSPSAASGSSALLTALLRALPCLLMAAVPAIAGAEAARQQPSPPRRPNILFVIADDWSHPHAGAYGDRSVKTPAFDRVAREGALFSHAFTMSPSCTPSRAAILTGQAVHRLAEGGNLHGTLPARFEVYPDLLEKAGYHVGFAGKGWGPGRSEPGGRSRNPAGPRFDDFESFLAKRGASQPFCFWFGSVNPHRPYEEGSGARAGLRADAVAVPPFLPDTAQVRSDLLDYYLEVQRFDDELGRLLQILERSGEQDDTLVVVTSDNGMPFPRAKTNLYDAGTRMPLAIRWPRRVKPGTTIDAFVSHQDLAPTFLEAAGVARAADATGRSLLPLLDGGPQADRDRVFFERERHANVRRGDLGYPARGLRTSRHLYIRNYRPERWPAGDPQLHYSVGPFGDIDNGPTKRQLLQRRGEPGIDAFFERATARRPAEELFDLAHDPGQLVNLAGDPAHAAALGRLREELSAWQRATGDPRLAEDDDRWDRFPYYGQPAKAEPPLSEASPPTPARPNVLLIVADDLGYTDLGVLGSEIRTPHLDALARSGLLLTSFLVSPTCSPTRAMLLSGADTHPAGLGTMAGTADDNQKGRPGYEGFLSDRVVSVATLLRDAGYHTYMAGKWHLGMDEHQGPHRRGFERSFALLPGGASHFADAAGLFEKHPQAPYREDGREVGLPAGFYSTAHYTDKLIEYIRGGLADGRPFFAYAAYTSPHWPLQLPDAELDRYRGAYDQGYDALRVRRFESAKRLGVVSAAAVPQRTPFARAWDALAPEQKRREVRAMELYAAMVENLDHHVGRLLQALRDCGRYDDTLVLFFPDNGAEGNQIGRMETNADWIPKRFDNSLANLGRVNSYAWLGPAWAQAVTPFRLWKAFPTEGGVRVPAIVRWGAGERRGLESAVVTVKDVAPTLLELAGARHPGASFEGRAVAPLEGRSMLPFLRGDTATVHGSDFTMGWELFGRRALRRGDWKIVWLFEPYGPARWGLFDLASDPLESKDLAGTHEDELAELLRAWDEYAVRNGVILPTRDMGYGLESLP
jgi:arylsulfatase